MTLWIQRPQLRALFAFILVLVVVSDAFTLNHQSTHNHNNRPLPQSTAHHSRVPTCLGPTARNGLTYEDVTIGSGRRVNVGDTILCYYEGSYQTGAGPFAKSVTFDATQPGEPIQLVIGKGQVIRGWDLGIAGDFNLEIPPMNIGGDRTLKIPANLAYGEAGAGGGAIPPNQDLEFSISVLSAEKQSEISMEYRLKGYALVLGGAAVLLGLGFFVLNNL